FRQVKMSDTMRQRLQRSNYIFSGIKTFHELNEAFPSLIDENGDRKPFEQFLNDVQKIDRTYNRNYLRAEYNFCHASATMAAKVEQFEEDEDRSNLQYRTANDDKVRPEHAALDRVTLPMSDPFWQEYYPPNGWNCRCTVVQVRKTKYPETPHEEAMARGEEATGKDAKGIFHFNPGIEKKTVPDYNPYTIRRCRDYDVAKGHGSDSPSTLSRPFVPENELCAACRLIRQAQAQRQNQKPTAQEFGTVTSIAVEWAQNNLDTTLINGQPGKRTMVTTADGFTIGVGNKFFTETAHKNKRNPDLAHILKIATEFRNWLPNARRIAGNAIEPGRHHAFSFSVYTVEYQGRTIEFKCKLTDGELIYNMRFI
ncbi:MAG: minor capsid protein, partial [Prevotella sp.]|nr:minor capsid protein [Prevotella sp.]